MTHEAELAHAFDRIWEKNSERNWIIGRLGTETGTNEAIDVVGRPGYVVVSLGAAGDQGVTIARDRVGAQRSNFQQVRMRRELGELVIREAAAYAGGTGGGSDTLEGLSDVVFTGLTSGQTIQYNGSNWINVAPPGGGGGAPSPHAHESSHHTPGSKLNWGTINFSSSTLSDIQARDHSQLNAIGPDQHHPHAHPLVGTDAVGVAQHTATGLVPGQTIRATSPTTFAWTQLLHTDLDPASILPNQHHNQQHLITGSDHTIAGNKFDLVGATADNVLGLLTPTHNPGASERILKTDANGSLIIDTNLLYVDAPFNRIGINRATAIAPESGAALDIVVGTNLNDHTQRIKQKAGQLGRLWRIENTEGHELIVLDAVGNLQSGNPGFYSGLRGWQVTPGGNAEFNDIWARGELHATVFVKDEVHATGGTFMVATAGKLHSLAQIDAATIDLSTLEVDSSAAAFPGEELLPLTIVSTSPNFSGTTLSLYAVGNVIDLDDPPSGPGFYFTPGEILRVKTEIAEEDVVDGLRLSDLWLEVMSVKQEDGYSSYSVMKRSGTDSIIPAGSAIVSYGHRGDGRILMTSDLNYAPYIDVFTTGQNPWDANDPKGIIPRMRMGQLMGVGVTGIGGYSQYGMIVGNDLTDTNASYLIASDREGIRLHKVPLTLNDGNADTGKWTAQGDLKLGKNVAEPTSTGFHFDPVNGNVLIGSVAKNHYLSWDQANGVLIVRGSLLVQDSGTTVTLDQVTALDNLVRTDASTYAGNAQTASIAYADSRRIEKVTGTWDDGGAAYTIRWSGVQIFLSNGTVRTMANSFANGISQRVYLYVDLAQSGTLTPLGYHSASVVQPTWALIAVFDPPAAGSGSTKASVTIVAGSTFISGGNIFTNSIHADRIVGNSITSTQVNSELFATTTNNHTAPYVSQRRVAAVYGLWTAGAQGSQAMSWSNVVIRYGDNRSQNITNGGFAFVGSPYSTWTYAYLTVDLTNTSTNAGFGLTDDLSTIGADRQAIAVLRRSTFSGYVSVTVLAGITYISGDSIITGSIVADNIAAGAVTANKITVNSNIAIAAFGSINGNGKTYGSAGGGFFLGHNGGSPGTYVFDIGDNDNYLRWSGSALSFRSETPLILSAESSNQVLIFSKVGAGSTGILRFNFYAPGQLDYNLDVRAQNLISTNSIYADGHTIRIATDNPVTLGTQSGTKGDIRWGLFTGVWYLYVCISNNLWKRIPMSDFNT